MALGLEDVLGNIHQHRTGASGGGDVKRFVNGLRQIRQLLHQEIVFGAGARDAERVGFLERVAADQLGGNLAGDGDDRNRIHHGVDQAGHQVGRARTGGRAAHAHLAGGARVSFRREAGVLLMPHQNVLDRGNRTWRRKAEA